MYCKICEKEIENNKTLCEMCQMNEDKCEILENDEEAKILNTKFVKNTILSFLSFILFFGDASLLKLMLENAGSSPVESFVGVSLFFTTPLFLIAGIIFLILRAKRKKELIKLIDKKYEEKNTIF